VATLVEFARLGHAWSGGPAVQPYKECGDPTCPEWPWEPWRYGPSQTRESAGRNRVTNIIVTDITAQNGVIHVIDRVLLPANKDIVQTAQGVPSLSILVEAGVPADLVATLKGPGPFTVFAPSNDAFAALLSELGITKDALLADKALLTNVLTYPRASQAGSQGRDPAQLTNRGGSGPEHHHQ